MNMFLDLINVIQKYKLKRLYELCIVTHDLMKIMENNTYREFIQTM